MLDMDRKERPPYVRFEKVAIEDVPASKVAGRYVAKDVDFALVTPPYSKDIFKQEAKDWLVEMKRAVDAQRLPPEWYKMFVDAYDAWQRGQEVPLNGTAIKGWPVIGPAQQENLIRLGILTVEDLASMNAEGHTRIGMGALDLQRKAQAWLEQANGKGPLTMKMSALESENDLLRGNISTLERQVQELQQAVRAMGHIAPQQVVTIAGGINAVDILDEPSEDLKAAYEAKFGKPPHHRMKPETIREALAE